MAPETIAWSPTLQQRAVREGNELASAIRRARVAALLRDPDAFHRFRYRWDTLLAYCVRCERHPQIMARDPEYIDAALMELSAIVALIPSDVSPRLHRIHAELTSIAERTRSFRQQCAFAQRRAPALA